MRTCEGGNHDHFALLNLNYRYEGAIRDRSIDIETAAITSGNPALSHDSEGEHKTSVERLNVVQVVYYQAR